MSHPELKERMLFPAACMRVMPQLHKGNPIRVHAFSGACLYNVPDTCKKKILPYCVYAVPLLAAAFCLSRSLLLSVWELMGGQLAEAAFVSAGACCPVRVLAFLRDLVWLRLSWDLLEEVRSSCPAE